MSFTIENRGSITIDTNGCFDTYEEFDHIFTQEVREEVFTLAGQLALDATGEPIPAEHLLVSGFDRDLTDDTLAETDAFKLSVPSSVPEGGFISSGFDDESSLFHGFEGDDSNTANIVERDIQALRDEKGTIGRELATDPPAARAAELLAELVRLNQEISALKEAKTSTDNMPTYYASSLDKLLDERPEDNPLAYAKFEEDDSEPALAFYDRRSIEAAGIEITEKGPNQYRIKTTGAELMRHCVAIIDIEYTSEAE